MVTTRYPRHGEEKLREIEEIMAGVGDFNQSFDLTIGDLVVEDEDEEGAGPKPVPDDLPKKKVTQSPFPSVDGDETMEQFIAKYKRTILSRRATFRTLHEQWAEAKPVTGKCLISTWHIFFFVRGGCK